MLRQKRVEHTTSIAHDTLALCEGERDRPIVWCDTSQTATVACANLSNTNKRFQSDTNEISRRDWFVNRRKQIESKNETSTDTQRSTVSTVCPACMARDQQQQQQQPQRRRSTVLLKSLWQYLTRTEHQSIRVWTFHFYRNWLYSMDVYDTWQPDPLEIINFNLVALSMCVCACSFILDCCKRYFSLSECVCVIYTNMRNNLRWYTQFGI